MPGEVDVPDAYRPKRRVDRGQALAELARRQHGVVSLEQLRGLGYGERSVSRAVAAGRLHRLYRGTFAVGHRHLTLRGRWMAAVLASGPTAMLSHCPAAHLRSFVRRSRGIDVTVPRAIRGRPGIKIHVATALTPADYTTVDAIPCASIALTLLGLAATAPADLPAALAQAAKRDALDLTTIDELLVRRPRAAGTPAFREALRAYRVEWEWSNSELERRAFELFAAAGLPRPDVNAWIGVPGSGFEVDFSWPELRLIVEVDGWESHGDRLAFEEDRRRDALLSAAGWRVVRFTWRQVVDDPAHVVATLRALTT